MRGTSYLLSRLECRSSERGRPRRAGAVLAAIVGLWQPSQADDEPPDLEVTCDPESRTVVILPTRESAEPEAPADGGGGQTKPGGAKLSAFRLTHFQGTGDCLLPPNVPVRVKLFSSGPMPYGWCGHDPGIYPSLWVDRRKWISLRQAGGRCSREPVSRVEISDAGMVWCTMEVDERGVPDGSERCESLGREQLPSVRDYIEYPLGRTKRPPVGSVVVEQGSETALRRKMISGNVDAQGAVWGVDLWSEWKIEPKATDRGASPRYGYFSLNEFDFDNDGTVDIVFGFHSETHARDADTYFLSPSNAFNATWPAVTAALLWDSGGRVFPNGTESCSGDECADGWMPLATYAEDGRPFSFRLRYLHAQPFLWEGSTYFYLESVDGKTEHVSAVLRLRKDARAEEVCVFRTVLDNY